jgi:hypothetical protein
MSRWLTDLGLTAIAIPAFSQAGDREKSGRSLLTSRDA